MSEKQLKKLLDVNDLISQINLNNMVDSTMLVRGTKITFPRNTVEERTKMKSYQGIE